ncbi:hypothetical protein [Rhodopirellula baltica]
MDDGARNGGGKFHTDSACNACPTSIDEAQNHGMNRSGGVVVFEVENRLPPLGYAHRYPTELIQC